MDRLTFLEKKFVFQSEISTFSLILISKNSEIFSGQGIVQSEPNWYPRLPVTFRLQCEKNGTPKFPRKKIRFSIGNIDLFAYSIFKK